jgi:hypothetical protein
MEASSRRAYWLEVVGLALLAVAFFRFGLLLLVFLVPIQLVWIRRGERAGTIASGVFLGALAILKVVDFLRLAAEIDQPGTVLPFFVDIVVALGLLAGIAVMNSRVVDEAARRLRLKREIRTADRMFVVVGVNALLYVPLLVAVAAGHSGEALVAAQMETIGWLLAETNATPEEIEALTGLVVDALLNGMALCILAVVAGNWWLGSRLALRARAQLPENTPVAQRIRAMRLASYSLSPNLVWALIGAWGGVVLSMVMELGPLRYVFWNAGLVMLVVYAIQGTAIAWHLLEKRGVGQAARIGLAVGLIICLLVPVLNLVVIVGLPGLGASEIWINYHRFDKGDDTE